jgi:hypothetical protein
MSFNAADPENFKELKTSNGNQLKEVDNFIYLGSYIYSSDKDMAVRISLAWAVSRKLANVWNSKLETEEKLKIFVTCVESVLLYGSETWVMTGRLENKINGTYTKLLRKAFSVSWYDMLSNEHLYDGNKKVCEKIRILRLKLAGHLVRHPETMADMDLFWSPSHGKRSIGRPKMNYIDQIKRDTGLVEPSEIRNAMLDRKTWKLYQ